MRLDNVAKRREELEQELMVLVQRIITLEASIYCDEEAMQERAEEVKKIASKTADSQAKLLIDIYLGDKKAEDETV